MEPSGRGMTCTEMSSPTRWAAAAPASVAAGIDRADAVAIVDIHAAVAADNTARGAGIGCRHITGVVAVDDRSGSRRHTDNAADTLGIRIFYAGAGSRNCAIASLRGGNREIFLTERRP